MSDETMKLTLELATQESNAAAINKTIANIKDLERQALKLKDAFDVRNSMKGFTGSFGKVDQFVEKMKAAPKALGREFNNAEKIFKQGGLSKELDTLIKKMTELDKKLGGTTKGKRKIGLNKGDVAVLRQWDALMSVSIKHADEFEEKLGKIGLAEKHLDSQRALYAKRAIAVKKQNNKEKDAEEKRDPAFDPVLNSHIKLFDRNQKKVQRLKIQEENRQAAVRRTIGADHLRAATARMREQKQLEREQMRAIRARHNMQKTLFGYASGAAGNAKHAITAMSHPFFSSPAFAAITGLTIALESLKHTIEETREVDRAATNLRIRGDLSKEQVKDRLNTARVNAIQYGTDAEHMLNIEVGAAARGLPSGIQKILPEMVMKFSSAVGMKPEDVTEHTGEFLQQMLSMHKISGPDQIFSTLNQAAAMSNKYGTPEKLMQAFENGLAERAGELHLSSKDTITIATLLNSMGARTGRSTTTALGNLSSQSPEWRDKYLAAQRKMGPERFSEANQLMLNAPSMLGYDNITSMSKDAQGLNGIKGIAKFFSSFRKVDEDQRKLLLKVLGFEEQVGGLIQGWIDSPDKVAAGLADGDKFAAQKDDDKAYVAQKQKEYKEGLDYIFGVFHGGMSSIMSAVGEQIKESILSPLVEPFQKIATEGVAHFGEFTKALLDGFASGMGYENITKLMEALTSLTSADFQSAATTMRNVVAGIGEGVVSLFHKFSTIGKMFGIATGALDARSMAKLATVMFGFALALHALAPVVGVITSVIALFKMLKDVVMALRVGGALISGGEVAAGAAGVGGLGSLAGLGAGLAALFAAAPITIGAIAATAVISAVIMNWDKIAEAFAAVFNGTWNSVKSIFGAGDRDEEMRRRMRQIPPSFRRDQSTFEDYVRKQVPPSYQDDLIEYGKKGDNLHKTSSRGGDDFHDLLQKASYITGGEDSQVKNALLSTDKAVNAMKDSMEKNGKAYQLAALQSGLKSGSSALGFLGGSGGGGSAGAPPIGESPMYPNRTFDPATGKPTSNGKMPSSNGKMPFNGAGFGRSGKGNWWTADRQKYAVDYLMKNAGLSQFGAEGLVSRWKNVEAAAGPTSLNKKSGAAGIGQWLGSRKGGFDSSFDSQLAKAARELNTTEKRAAKILRQAKTHAEGAVGASVYERAEHYDPKTGVDDWTGKSAAGGPGVHSDVTSADIAKKMPDAAGIGKAVPTHGSNGAGGSSGGHTIHAPINITHPDPQIVARAVSTHINDRLRDAALDVEYSNFG